MDVKQMTSSVANRLLLDFPSGLDGELAFSNALTLSPQIAQLGRVDLNGSNPIPEFLPEGIYHFEKDSSSIRVERIVLWTEVSRMWLRRYVVLDSTWKVTVINSSESLPRF